jgi:hypothetical protein
MDERNPELEEARAFLEEFTKGMAYSFGVRAAARTLVETAIGLLLGSAGRGETIEFFRDVLDDVEHLHPEDSAP